MCGQGWIMGDRQHRGRESLTSADGGAVLEPCHGREEGQGWSPECRYSGGGREEDFRAPLTCSRGRDHGAAPWPLESCLRGDTCWEYSLKSFCRCWNRDPGRLIAARNQDSNWGLKLRGSEVHSFIPGPCHLCSHRICGSSEKGPSLTRTKAPGWTTKVSGPWDPQTPAAQSFCSLPALLPLLFL